MSGVDLRVNVLYKHIFNKQQLNKEIAGVGKDMAKHWASVNPTTLSKNFSDTFEKTYQKMKPTLQSFHDKVLKTVIGTTAHESDLNKMWYKFFKGINKKGQLSAFLSPEDRLAKRKNPSDKTLVDLAQQYTRMILQGEVQADIDNKRLMQMATSTTSPSYKLYKKRVQESERLVNSLLGKGEKTEKDVDKKTERLRRATDRYEKQQIEKAESTKHKTWQDIFMDSVNSLTSRNPVFDQMKKYYLQQDKNAKTEQKKIEEDKKKDDDLRKKQFALMLGKWGKLGIGGMVARFAFGMLSSVVSMINRTSQESMDWQRTIRGGASGGAWFGQGLAAYGRAGIGANQYQGFKRGIQGYLGSVKLGMGNAAPLMYLGLSALGNPDELERQLERNLRRLPKDVSLALAGQMGLDYNMWDAIYSGRLDRQRSAYSEEAIQKWGKLADSINDLVVTLNSFFFNTFAPVAEGISKVIDNIIDRKSGGNSLLNLLGFASGYLNPATQLQTLLKFDAIEITLKDKEGNIIEQTSTKVTSDGFIEIPQS